MRSTEAGAFGCLSYPTQCFSGLCSRAAGRRAFTNRPSKTTPIAARRERTREHDSPPPTTTSRHDLRVRSVPTDGFGSVLPSAAAHVPLLVPAEVRDEPGCFVLYSLADHEIVATSNPFTVQKN